ncbi:hypothetical protein OG863_38145 [Streptomyces decoyicus]|uniref:Uncharacterized protein n=1 Tax=Streptomyces decoyicus TaxID=249567 RepID=A0ABZ1FTT4_9ACTN|nr:hypothetical protein [Streptomyces decoyicus]WSB73300.1 hypothetical protein OG863_38145 [Streptomyces decoyicus]
MAIEEVAPVAGAVRLREMLRGTATASESRFMRGLRQGREQGVLVGAALHAAERSRLGKPLTELERVLLKALSDLMPQADVHACGQEYRSAVADLGSLDIVPASVTSRSLSTGYTVTEFKERLPVIGREAVTLANAALVDPAVLAIGQAIDTAEFKQGIREFGYGATVFNRPPQPPEERGRPVPGYRAKVEFDSFYVRRAVGDQWGGKDEIYWTVAAASDKHKAPTYKSSEFGAIKKSDTRSFTGVDRVVFDGQAGTHLGLHVAAWEADQSSSEWYDKLFEVLQEVVDGLHVTDLLNNFNPTFAGDLLGYALEITKLFIFLKEYLRNKDDLSCERMLFFDRHTLVTLFNRGQDTWEFNGEGHHSLRIRYTGQRPVFPAGALEYVTVTGSAHRDGRSGVCVQLRGQRTVERGNEAARPAHRTRAAPDRRRPECPRRRRASGSRPPVRQRGRSHHVFPLRRRLVDPGQPGRPLVHGGRAVLDRRIQRQDLVRLPHSQQPQPRRLVHPRGPLFR